MSVRPKVSVIVCAYNAANTLPRCLDSLTRQTLKEIEIICVDDGSTDEGAAIMDAYGARDTRFKVFHKKNEGISASRQFGIEKISGTYFIFLDADDYVEDNAYARLYDTAVTCEGLSADMVICNALRITKEGTRTMDYASDDLSAKAVAKRMFSWETSALWNRLIKTELVKRYGLRFPEYLQLAEDRNYLLTLLNRSIARQDDLVIVHIPDALIHYDNVSNPHSLTQESRNSRIVYSRFAQSYRILQDELDMSVFGVNMYGFICSLAFSAFWTFQDNDLSESDFQEFFAPFESGLREFVSPCYQKRLVLIALKKGIPCASRLKWTAVPAILKDKIDHLIQK